MGRDTGYVPPNESWVIFYGFCSLHLYESRTHSHRFHSLLPFPTSFLFSFFNKIVLGTSLVVQWLTVHLLVQGTWVPSLVRELRSHMP